MNAKEWLEKTKGDQRRQLVANDAGTTVKYIGMLARGERRGSVSIHQRLHSASLKHTPEFVMTLEKLNPEVWPASSLSYMPISEEKVCQ